MDVTSAFLNGDQQEVYMRQPEKFQVKGKEHLVYKKPVRIETSSKVLEYDFGSSVKKDGIYTSQKRPMHDKERMNDVKSKLSVEFEVKDLGELQYLLGFSIIQNHLERSVWIGQPTYTLNVLEKFDLQDAKPVATEKSHRW
uniref:Reverse transcriptase Ty1/copia-type domain-containing protein n=1 Tax=Amphimedon queenslandica TaxID=400682 RepID=A0A1X7TMH5_AMPQE